MTDNSHLLAAVVTTTTVTKTITMQLSEQEATQIIRDWAKAHGFSHRAQIEFDCGSMGYLHGITIKETLVTTS